MALSNSSFWWLSLVALFGSSFWWLFPTVFTPLYRPVSFFWEPFLYDGTNTSDWIVSIQKESSQCRSHRTDS